MLMLKGNAKQRAIGTMILMLLLLNTKLQSTGIWDTIIHIKPEGPDEEMWDFATQHMFHNQGGHCTAALS